MRVRPDQLAAHLRKTLAPLYLVFGEEPLQSQEAADAIRAAARERGYDERECLTVEAGFDWDTLRQRAASRSLFAGRRLLDLRLGNAKPGDAGAKALADYAARPADDAVLLITAGKLDWQTQKSRWFAALDGAGVVVQAAPVELRSVTGLDRTPAAEPGSESHAGRGDLARRARRGESVGRRSGNRKAGIAGWGPGVDRRGGAGGGGRQRPL